MDSEIAESHTVEHIIIDNYKNLSVLFTLILFSIFLFPSVYAAQDFIVENRTSALFIVNGTTGNIIMAPSFGLVGIGTSSPYNTLTVVGSAGISGTLNASSINTTGNAYFATSSGSVGIGTTSPYNTLTVVGSISANSINATSINATERLIINNTLFVNGSRVGIGTSAPTDLVHINTGGNLRVDDEIVGDSTLTIRSNTAASNYISFDNTGAGVTAIRAADDIQLQTTGSGFTRVYIDAAGFVGINTSSPSGTFHVKNANTDFIVTAGGNVGIGTTGPQNKLEVIGAVTVAGTLNASSINTTGNAYFATSSAKVGIGKTNPATELDVAGGINASTLNVSGNAFLATQSGKVGIGTTTPVQTLTVRGNISAVNPSGTAFFTVYNGSNSNIVAINDVGNNNPTLISFQNQGTQYGVIDLNGGQRFGIGSNQLVNLQFLTENNVRMTINATEGQVGINTTKPIQTLQVAGTLNVSNPGRSGDLFVASSGSVGIGTTAPYNTLTVVGSISANSINATSINATERLIINNTLFVNGSRVGIGTSAPVSALHVSGTATLNTNNAQSGVNLGGNIFIDGGRVQWGAAGSTADVSITRNAAQTLIIENEGGTDIGNLIVTGSLTSNRAINTSSINVTGNAYFAVNSGNVGIGTTNPAHKLTVAGSVNITGNISIGNSIYLAENQSLWQPVYGTDDDLVLYLPFNAPNGSTQFDRSPYGNDGILQGGINCNVSQGKYGTGCLFNNNTNDYIDLGTKSASNWITNTSDFSIEAWINLRDSSGTLKYILVDETNEFFRFGISTETSINTWQFPTSVSVTTTRMTLNEWHHVVATFDSFNSTNGNAKIYIDGALDGVADNQITFPEPTTSWQIGGSGTAARFFNGTMDEIKIYKRLLTPEEIRTHYLRGNSFGADGAITADKFRIVNTTGSKIFEVNQTGASISPGGNQRLTIDSSGNVGIGTSSPNGKLNVIGGVNITGGLNVSGGPIRAIGSNSDYIELLNDGAGNSYVRTPSSGGSNLILAVEGNSAMYFRTNAAYQMILDQNGQLAIGKGSNTPSDKLEVVGSVRVSGSLNASSINTTGNAYFATSSGSVGIGLTNPNYLLQVASGTDGRSVNLSNVLYVNGSSGNVGIGTTSPTQLLTVAGSVTAYGSLNATNINASRIDIIGPAAKLSFLDEANTERALIRISDTGADQDSLILYNPNEFMYFRTKNSDDATGTSMVIDSNGFVGINDTSPDARLEIAADGNTPFMVSATAAGDGNRFIIDSSGKVGIGTTSPATTLDVKGKANFTGNFSIGQTSNIFFVDNTSGNIGIGTTSPNKGSFLGRVLTMESNGTLSQSVIELASRDVAEAGNIGSVSFIHINSTQASNVAQISALRGVTNDSGALAFSTRAPGGGVAEAVRIDSSGNVGIGTANPNYLLQTASGTDGRSINLSNVLFVNGSYGNVAIGTSNTNRIQNNPDFTMLTIEGTLGKGPGLTFSGVNISDGNAAATIYFVQQNLTGTTYTNNYLAGITTLVDGGFNKGALTFLTDDGGGNNIERMRIDSSGNVGIGTTAPLNTLHVNGSGAQGGFRVTNESGQNVFFVNSTSGNVGIGTTSSKSGSSELMISDSAADGDTAFIELIGNRTGENLPAGGLLFYNVQAPSNNNQVAQIDAATSNPFDADAGTLRFWTYDTSGTSGIRMLISPSGNVGIGTAAPSQTLHVIGTLNVSHSGGHGDLFVASSGNVGINTTDPSAKLDIFSNIATEQVMQAWGNTPTGFYGRATFNYAGSTIFRINTIGSGSNFILGSEGTDVITIDENQKVGINTTSPGSTLTVVAKETAANAIVFNVSNATGKTLCTIDTDGQFVCTGTKSALVGTDNYEQRLFYAIESPDVRHIDEGRSKLKNGFANVSLDPIFKETIEGEYSVYLTPEGKTKALYVAEKSKDYFVVKDTAPANAVFSYIISAYRKGYTSKRFDSGSELEIIATIDEENELTNIEIKGSAASNSVIDAPNASALNGSNNSMTGNIISEIGLETDLSNILEPAGSTSTTTGTSSAETADVLIVAENSSQTSNASGDNTANEQTPEIIQQQPEEQTEILETSENKFIISTTDEDEIIKQIQQKTKLDRDEIKRAIKFKKKEPVKNDIEDELEEAQTAASIVQLGYIT
ncbi:LamG domain-containing protein, partial [Candidatus Woesearchaeota archaeon]|nr:LamG domain-containing protein [Candidatus Woesearchaeota archaeon]